MSLLTLFSLSTGRVQEDFGGLRKFCMIFEEYEGFGKIFYFLLFFFQDIWRIFEDF
jgi:hypothetical protein